MVITTNTSFELWKLQSGSKRDFYRVMDFSAFIEPASDEIQAIYEEGYPGGQIFKVFVNYLNIEIGNKLKSSDGEYIVQGVKKYDSIVGRHCELIVRKGV